MSLSDKEQTEFKGDKFTIKYHEPMYAKSKVRESVKKILKGFLDDWEFSKKAKAEPYIHFRRVIERITKEMGDELC